jgi:hypothetical protein
LVTGIAHIAAGYVQTRRNGIAFFQQSIIVWMAAMSFGPAAIAWLRRGHGRTDKIFFVFTLIYAAALFSFTLYADSQLAHFGPHEPASNLPLECFLDSDDIPPLYKEHAMRVLNVTFVSLSVGIIVISGLSNLFYKKYRPGGVHSFFATRPKLDSFWEIFVIVIVVVVEVLLFVLAWETTAHYRRIVPQAQQAAEGAWGFGQLIPFMMLLYPILLGLRAWIEGDVIAHVEENMPVRTNTINTTVSTVETFGNGKKFGAT